MDELVIDGMSAAGEGIGRLADGRVLFVANTVPGDRVRVRLGERRQRVQYADLVEVLDPSALRVRSRCTVDACGGCALKVVSNAGQADLKRRRVLDALRRIGGFDVATLNPTLVQVGDGWRYRHRVRLHAYHLGHRFELGYYAAKSHTLVPLAGCPVLWRELEATANTLATALATVPREVHLVSVELAHSLKDARTAAVLNVNGDVELLRHSLNWIDAAGLSGVAVVGHSQSWRHGNLTLRYDHGRADDYTLWFEPDLFTQAFPQVNDALVAAAMRALNPAAGMRILEFHAGLGNFTIPLSLSGATVTAVEQSRRSAILGRRNLKAAGVSAMLLERADHDALGLLAEADRVLLDPPRTGARALAEAMATNGPEQVAYVSCDPATLARDARILAAGGYAIKSLELFDMFPETPHVESLLVMQRGTP